jgi:hypothetical protein
LHPVNPLEIAKPGEPSLFGIKVHVSKEAPNSKGCPECGSPSRHKATCSSIKAKVASIKRKLGQACDECGSLSRRHKKGCSLAGGNAAWAALDKGDKRAGLMSERQYSQVKTAHNHGMDPTSIAHEMNLTMKEVNTAVLSKTFEVYNA